MRWLDGLGHDFRHAVRGLAAAPAVSLAAVATLALGLGLATAMFAVVHALLLTPLPYAPDADRLVRLIAYQPAADAAAPPRRLAVQLTEDEARQIAALPALEGAGIVAPTVVGLPGVENAGHVAAVRLSGAALALLDGRVLLGRKLQPDDRSDTDAAVIGHQLWQRQFGGDPAVVGRPLGLDTVLGRRASRTVTVVGVMPPTFTFPASDTQLWMPLAPAVAGAPPPRGRLLGRLAPGVSAAAALPAIEAAMRGLRPQDSTVRYELAREVDELVGGVRPALRLLIAAVGALLLIACLNVAGLLLARSLARHRELSVRAAMGATRARLVRQCLTESLLLSAAGGAGGIAVASGALAAFRVGAAALPRIDLTSSGAGWGGIAFPRLDDVAVNGGVLAFAVAMSVVAGLVAGGAAARRAARADVFAGLRAAAGATGTDRSGARVRRGLVVLQVGGATALLVGAVLLARSLQALLAEETGYRTDHVLTFQVGVPAAQYPDDRLQAFAEALSDRLRALPDVTAAAYANQVPMVGLRDTAGGLWTTPDAARRPAPDAADARFVSRDYFAAMGIRVRAGRGFEPRDGRGQPRVLVVNEALARRQFPGSDPIGRQVYVGRDVVPWTIVGVVADVRQFGLDRPPEPQFFADLRQWSGGMPLFPGGAYFVVHAARPPAGLVPEIRAAVRGLDAGAAIFNVAPLETIVAATVARPRLYAVLLAGIAGIAVVLAAVGLYGVLAHVVHERTAEIGVRMALGATRGRVLRLVFAQGAGLVGAGLLLGGVGAAALARSAAALLYGVQPLDPTTFLSAITALGGIAAIAILVPARRASRVDPLAAIRCE